jgi:transposase
MPCRYTGRSQSKAIPVPLPERCADHPLSQGARSFGRTPTPDTSPGISASQAAGILVKRPENRSEEELRTLKRLKTVHQVTERCCTLFEEFAGMLRDKEQSTEEQARSRLKKWTEQAKASGVPELKAFAVKLLQDIEAVVAAMILPYSQGQTEGRVNKLKFIKRSMYGRGKFDLLRQRVLYASAA